MALTDGLLAYYKLDESSGNASDSSGNGKTLTNTGTVTYGSAKINNGAIGTNTTGGYLKISEALGFAATGDHSWNFWYKCPSSMTGYIVDNITATGDNKRLIVYEDNAVKKLHMFANGNEVLTQALTSGQWYMITINKSGANWELFVNNVSKGTTTTGSLIYNGGAGFMLLNSLYTGGSQTTATIDEVGIWSRLLDSSDRAELYNSGNGLQYPFGSIYPTSPEFMLNFY